MTLAYLTMKYNEKTYISTATFSSFLYFIIYISIFHNESSVIPEKKIASDRRRNFSNDFGIHV